MAILIPFVDHDSAIKGTANKYPMLFEKHYLFNLFVLILNLVSRSNILQLFSSFTAKLPDITTSVPDKESSAFESKLACCDVCLALWRVQLSK